MKGFSRDEQIPQSWRNMDLQLFLLAKVKRQEQISLGFPSAVSCHHFLQVDFQPTVDKKPSLVFWVSLLAFGLLSFFCWYYHHVYPEHCWQAVPLGNHCLSGYWLKSLASHTSQVSAHCSANKTGSSSCHWLAPFSLWAIHIQPVLTGQSTAPFYCSHSSLG